MAPRGTVLITGCSNGGIGSALALCFQKKGFHVFATARDAKKMSDLDSLPETTLLTLDVVNAEQIKAAVDAVSNYTGGTLTYLLNNAGIARYMPLLDEDMSEVKRHYDTNVWGPLEVMKAFMPLLMKAKGTVIFNTSASGYVNVPYQAVYAGGKRATDVMAATLALELAPFDVKVVSIVTAAVESNALPPTSHDLVLPETSLYKPIESMFISRAHGNDGAKRMPRDQYAEQVVTQIIGGATGKIWAGGMAATVKFVTDWLPLSWLNNSFMKGSGIDVLLKSK
ncbi:NAD(P)-binding protein [Polyplosphaeria fusca]|uniref:NAD(P)-binding protein n=1 Tax=Polyplosphaeria fusca TaxID=682080 RepID=A0A9P4QTL0_9PLEO|nr:NAD(P)-binding protein [Polyplosphaeria fusca]